MDTPDDSPALDAPWLAELEARVREAAAEIGRLRHDNRRLEKELARLRKAGAGNGGAAAWEQQRAEVRSRLERLTEHLEGALGESPAPVDADGDGDGAAPDA